MGTSVRQLLLMTDKKMETTISKEKKTSTESTSMKEENLPEGLSYQEMVYCSGPTSDIKYYTIVLLLLVALRDFCRRLTKTS
jgi:hypothetical protein